MLTERLLQLTIAGGSEWVMVLLLLLSVLSISVVIERAIFFYKRSKALEHVDSSLAEPLKSGDGKHIARIIERAQISEPIRLVATASVGAEAIEKILAGSLERYRLFLERRLAFLGTLGSNAPFIGLFGTVLGIIRAFRDLSLETKTGASAVMAGISEALVATAVGLFVAIPAVIAFNYFQRQADRLLAITESLVQQVSAVMTKDSKAEP